MTMNLSKTNMIRKRNATKRNRRRKVTFSDTVVTNMKKVTQNDRTKAWYSKEELEAMRKHVKVQSKIYRAAMNNSSPDASIMSSLVLPFQGCTVEKKMKLLTMSCASTASTTPSATFRGLESHIFLEKQRNRIIAMKTTLEYQRRAQELLKVAESQNHPDIKRMKECFSDRLATVCNQLSIWSTSDALAIAKFDESGVYESPPVNVYSLLDNEEQNMKYSPLISLPMTPHTSDRTLPENKVLDLKQKNFRATRSPLGVNNCEIRNKIGAPN